MQRNYLPGILLSAGLAFVLGNFGIDKFVHPLIWIGWLPDWMDGLASLSKEAWLTVIAIAEIIMAVLILIPVRQVRMTGCILIALHLLGILTQVGWNDIAVRDIGLLAAVLALLGLL